MAKTLKEKIARHLYNDSVVNTPYPMCWTHLPSKIKVKFNKQAASLLALLRQHVKEEELGLAPETVNAVLKTLTD